MLTGATTPDGRDVVETQNVASADIHGVESLVRWHASDVLDAELVVNYQRGDQAGEDGVDTPADRMPPLNGRLGLRYQATGTLAIESFVRFADRQDRLSPRDVRDVRINPDGTPGWMTVNVAATWDSGNRWRASRKIRPTSEV